ncbi:MAG: aminotransferase class I/II-fold pyridoxal phosphate-dependent enzyme, partial [Anaerolineales bacterium]|nr:aminotransferase class I/II-fold pyridoxal phosphate-dependent enzyme [Anaerolineales bacterium]
MNKIDISLLCISKDSTLRQAVVCIDKGGLGIAMVVDGNQHLLGTITDGDIRRAILAGDAMGAQIQRILDHKSATIYPKAVTAPQSAGKNEILGLMKKWVLRHVPLLDDEGHVVDLVTLDDLLPTPKLSLQAVVLAGGEQTRLHPLAADLPRPMLPIGNRPLMEYTINQLREAGIRDVSLTTHYKADAVVDYFKDGSDFGVHINYLDEKKPSGILGGLRLLEKKDTPLLVINGDVLTRVDFRAMLTYHQEQQAEMTVAVRLHDFAIPYDVIETQDGQVSGVIEKPSFQRFINAGAYLLSPEIPDLIPQGQAFDMTDLITQLVLDGRRVVSFPIHEYWREIQGYDDYQQAAVDVKNGLFADLALAVAGMEPGAPPPSGFVPLCVPELHGNEWAYIKECLDTNWVSSVGSFVDRFEQMLAEFSGNKYAVAASSGTAALHTALMVAGIQPGDEVILSALTFIAPANAVRYAGAWPVFIDAEPDYWQMDPEKLAEFLENSCWLEGGMLINRVTGRPVRAVIPVHILGHPCQMEEIVALARKY